MINPVYLAQLDSVASNLYSLDFHFCRWEEASVKEKAKYVRKAHLAKVWWDLELNRTHKTRRDAPPEISAAKNCA